MKKVLLVALGTLVFTLLASAKEGMWIPTMLASIENDMQAFGLQLSAEEIYSVNQSSLKDAIVQFGGGCTGEMISSEGLLLTNHHCGYRQIQSHSSLERNLLRDGFWAMSKEEELPNPGLTAMFVVSITDVTGDLLKGVNDDDDNSTRRAKITANEKGLVQRVSEQSPGLEVFVRPFNYGNSYFMMITRTYTDVRLVGAPPSSIGKYGGDTDNWVWPRHTGDFSLFRVYANADNEPAQYSENNQPYQPLHHLPVSLDGVNEGDFTMVFGFPGRTELFLPKAAVAYVVEEANPMRIAMRETSLGIIDAAMRSDESLHIKYAAKQSSISNAYKKWIGQNIGLKELNAIDEKRKVEGAVRARASLRANFSVVQAIDRLNEQYSELRDYQMGRDVFIEYYYYGPELFRFANRFESLIERYDELEKSGKLDAEIDRMRGSVQAHFKNYDKLTDELIFEKLTALYFQYMPTSVIPEVMSGFHNQHKANPAMMRTQLYGKSVFTQPDALIKLFDAPSAKGFSKLGKDPAYQLASGLWNGYNELIKPDYDRIMTEIEGNLMIFVQGIQEYYPETQQTYDANSTLRLTYGKVEGSAPYDGMKYTFGTTHKGILQKAATENPDYAIDEFLDGLLRANFFGPYANEDGNLPVCFTGSNHTTGGNSGSPAINGKGELVGLNFDRTWESTMSDLYYDADRCRNIMVDVRYILWVIDAYAGAGHLVQEMTLSSDFEKDTAVPIRK